MTNPIFKMMNGNNNHTDMMNQFKQFMGQMKGHNPNEILNNLVSSGKINQTQLNQVQTQAQQIEKSLSSMKNMFGF